MQPSDFSVVDLSLPCFLRVDEEQQMSEMEVTGQITEKIANREFQAAPPVIKKTKLSVVASEEDELDLYYEERQELKRLRAKGDPDEADELERLIRRKEKNRAASQRSRENKKILIEMAKKLQVEHEELCEQAQLVVELALERIPDITRNKTTIIAIHKLRDMSSK
jgi:hypothetical protein